ncbi:probable ATP-dependent RNA helicase DHX40, partial [Pseudonaja textilis]|uniref:probable ATP-dependent RNA helicase DHX40 n=1 Tax=Pseudonaja textilis TaxID=8673 RepID=UPI000EAA3827
GSRKMQPVRFLLGGKQCHFTSFPALLLFSSESPSVWCQENWVHWRAVKLAFSVERQLREIINRLKQLPDFLKEDFDGSRNEILRRCLCAGYFANVARRSSGKSFRTMDGHGSVAYIHPSSA